MASIAAKKIDIKTGVRMVTNKLTVVTVDKSMQLILQVGKMVLLLTRKAID